MEAPNVLLLDEPTNDLDINTLNILEDFLDSYIGVVVVVSHDRYFLDRVCNKIFAYEGNGEIVTYNGNYSDYSIKVELKKANKETEVKKEKKENAQRVRERDSRPKFSFKEQKEYEEISSVIENLENEIANVDKLMQENSASYSKLQELMTEKEKLEEELLYKYERYEYLEDLAQRIEEYKNNNKI